MSCAWAQGLLFLDRKLSQTQCHLTSAVALGSCVRKLGVFSAWSREPGTGGRMHVPFGAEQVLSVL